MVKLEIPALRDRPEDIVFLAERFLKDMAGLDGPLVLKEDTKNRLREHPWPGNVRELRNIVDRGAALSDRYFRLPEDFGISVELDGWDGLAPGSGVGLLDESYAPLPEVSPPAEVAIGTQTRPLWEGKTYKEAKDAVMADFEQGYVQDLLAAHRGNVSAAARAAGIHRNILHRMMARYGIER